jgi:hypothetical protein
VPVALIPLVAGILFWVAALYAGAMAILAHRASWAGGARYMGAQLLIVVPAIAALRLIVQEGQSPGLTLLSLVVLLLAVPSALLLPAWPLAVSLSAGAPSPLRVFRATKGHRWGLIGAAILATAPFRTMPDIMTTTDSGTASFYFLLGSALSAFNLIIATGTAATAWQFTIRNDPALEPA